MVKVLGKFLDWFYILYVPASELDGVIFKFFRRIWDSRIVNYHHSDTSNGLSQVQIIGTSQETISMDYASSGLSIFFFTFDNLVTWW